MFLNILLSFTRLLQLMKFGEGEVFETVAMPEL